MIESRTEIEQSKALKAEIKLPATHEFTTGDSSVFR